MSELARRYAEALYGLFQDEDKLRASADSLRAVPELWDALTNPTVHPDAKQRILARQTDRREPEELKNFFTLLARRGRMALLPDILGEYHGLALREKNAAECVMTCVREPDVQRQERIKAALCKLHHKSAVQLILRLDPKLLGGFILNMEGMTYDRSVRGELRALARHLEEVNTP
ncbi:MAG: ATP synthase F1 subunit delta [Lawsonibacter sp.]